MDRRNDIINTINEMSGKYQPYTIFSDWVRCMAIAIQNACDPCKNSDIWKNREQEYMDTIKRYSAAEQMKLSGMMQMLTETADDMMCDMLGDIYMRGGMGSKSTGQFFTPYHLSELCARMSTTEPDEHGIVKINEPSCGGGGMIIAAASDMKNRGINYQQSMDVIAQDLDWNGTYMCYVQLSLYGISAVVVQGDTLCNPYIDGKTDEHHILRTPMWYNDEWMLRRAAEKIRTGKLK